MFSEVRSQSVSSDLIGDLYSVFSEFVSTSVLANIICIYLLIILTLELVNTKLFLPQADKMTGL